MFGLNNSNNLNLVSTIQEIKVKKKIKKAYNRGFTDNIEFLLLGLPAILHLLIFCYLPMIGIIIAFKDFRYDIGILESKWVGFNNFKFFFQSLDAWRITGNTIGLNALFIIFGLFVGVSLALLLFEIKQRIFIKTYQTILILPQFLSWVVVGYMTYALLNPNMGLLNKALETLGFESIKWYSQPKIWPFLLVIINQWKVVGMSCIMYYAALIGIDTEYYEAAKIDGANKFHMTWYISIPFLIPMMIVLTIIAIGNIFRADFGMFYNVTRDIGMLYSTTDVIDTYIYRALRVAGNVSMSAAVGLFQSFVGFILVLVTNYIVKKIEPDNALF